MKTAPTVILIINDGDDSFTTAITTGLQTSNLKQSTEVFELSLKRYGVTDVKAAGSVTHFVDSNGVKQVGEMQIALPLPEGRGSSEKNP
nr:hypothetical protein [Tanacetum cinerariifolium]